MPEAITSPSEKLVPIDTSGNSVDVTLKEDKEKGIEEVTKEDAPIVEVVEDKVTEEVVETPSKENKEEELEEYSAGVKRRIDKLTRKMREAERREQAAIDYAKKVQEENKNLHSMSLSTSRERIASDEERLTSNEALLKSALQQAVEQADAEKQVLAQQEIAKLAIEKERLKLRKAKQVKIDSQKEETPVQEPWGQAPKPVTPPDPKAEAWAGKNEWFGTDKAMTYTAMSFHDDLVSEGFDGKGDAYYKELDKRIRKEFPHKFEDKNKDNRVVQTVVSANRSTKRGRRTVRLTPSQVAIAKKLGVPLEEYAKHVKEA